LLRCVAGGSGALVRSLVESRPVGKKPGDDLMKRFFALAAGIAASLTLCSAFSPASAQSPEKKDVHIAVGGKPALYYLPLTRA
jgi:hypothetical protein